MGKREVLLIVGFLLLGALVYQVSAPPASDSGGRSWRDALRQVRGGMFGAHVKIPVERPLRREVGPDLTTLDLGDVNGRVEVAGEARETIEGVARITLAGLEDSAEDKREADEGLSLSFEQEGDRLVLRVAHAEEWRINRSGRGRPSLDLQVKVPARLALKLGVSGVADVQGVAGVELQNARGNVTLRHVAGPVTGGQRDGMLEVSGAKSLEVEVRRVNVRLDDIDGDVELEATDGGIEAKGLTGKTTLTTRRAGVEIVDQAGPLRLDGTEGRAELRGLAAGTDLEASRMAVRVDLAKPVPFTAETTEGSLDLRLPEEGGLTLKIEAQEGSVVVPDGVPSPQRAGVTMTLDATNLRGGGPLVTLSSNRTAVTVKAP